MVQVYSFDVFDTCLARRLAMPSTVFHEAARNAFAALGLPSSHSLIEDFVSTRLKAEHLARQQTNREDVSLAEIWQMLAELMVWKYDSSLPLCELEAEEKSIVPISSMRKQVQMARQQGKRIVFLSDMYLPGDFIERLLIKHGFAEAGDGFYVSGDIGKTKRSGNLFKHFLAQEKVAAAQVLHTGDNRHADYDVPLGLGLQAALFEQSRMTETELRLLEANCRSPEVARIVGAMRAFRLGQETDDEDMNEVVSQFIAPFVMGFAVWVLRKAQEEGVKRLYFVSRDGQLIFKVARELAPQFGGIDCRYLYSSRQALFLSSIKAVSSEKMPWMRKEYEEPSLKALLAKIDLTYEDVEPFLGDLAGSQRGSYCLASEEEWERFWHALNEMPVRARLNAQMTRRRETTRRYFEAEGLFDSINWAVVDFGWYLTCQKSLVELLKSWGRQEQVRGYYLGLHNQRVGRAEADHAEALFYHQPADFPFPEKSNVLFFHVILVEHVIGCADHPTLHHYEELPGGVVGPAFATSVDEMTLKFCRKLHEGVLDFVGKNQPLAEDFRNPIVCRDMMLSLANSFFKSPTPGQVRAVLALSDAIDQTALASPIPISKPLSFTTALLPLLPKRYKLFAPLWKDLDCYWPEGSIAITPSRVKGFSAGVQQLVKSGTRTLRVLFRRKT